MIADGDLAPSGGDVATGVGDLAPSGGDLATGVVATGVGDLADSCASTRPTLEGIAILEDTLSGDCGLGKEAEDFSADKPDSTLVGGFNFSSSSSLSSHLSGSGISSGFVSCTGRVAERSGFGHTSTSED